MVELEHVVDGFIRATDIYHRQRLQLERGLLTEELVRQAELRSVLEEVRRSGFRPLHLHWYYQYAEVKPIWDGVEHLAFSVALPAVGPDHYMLYGLHYLPVLLDSKHVRTLVGEPEVAVNSVKPFSFIPTECIGRAPTVCRLTLERRHTSCEAALVSGEDPSRCSVHIAKRGQETISVVPPSRGATAVAVAAYGDAQEVVRLRWRGKRVIVRRIRGPVLLDLPQGCHLEGRDWTLYSEVLQTTNIHYEAVKPMTLPSINITWLKSLHPAVVAHLAVLPRITVPLVSLHAIRETSSAKFDMWPNHNLL